MVASNITQHIGVQGKEATDRLVLGVRRKEIAIVTTKPFQFLPYWVELVQARHIVFFEGFRWRSLEQIHTGEWKIRWVSKNTQQHQQWSRWTSFIRTKCQTRSVTPKQEEIRHAETPLLHPKARSPNDTRLIRALNTTHSPAQARVEGNPTRRQKDGPSLMRIRSNQPYSDGVR